MRAPFFRQKPPRTAGREEFGGEYVGGFLRLCRGASKADVVATATALTARSIADAIRRFVLRDVEKSYRELIVSGGGAKNPTLMAMLRRELSSLGLELRFSDEFGVPAEAKEAVAFAVLAYRDMASAAVERAVGDGGEAAGDPGKDFVCVRAASKMGTKAGPSLPKRELARATAAAFGRSG